MTVNISYEKLIEKVSGNGRYQAILLGIVILMYLSTYHA